MLSRHSVGTYQGEELTRHLSGNTWPLSSQLAETLWTDPGLKSGIGMRVLISTKKKNQRKRRRRGVNHGIFPPNPCKRGRSHHHRSITVKTELPVFR